MTQSKTVIEGFTRLGRGNAAISITHIVSQFAALFFFAWHRQKAYNQRR
jgi:hypothetical protein